MQSLAKKPSQSEARRALDEGARCQRPMGAPAAAAPPSGRSTCLRGSRPALAPASALLTAQARPAMPPGVRCFRSSGAPESRRADDARLILAHQRAAAGGTRRASEPPVDRLGRGESVARARDCARGRARHGFVARRVLCTADAHLRLHRSSAAAAVQQSRPRRGGPARPRTVDTIGM